jgi:two-component system response regulator YesN
MYRVMIVEDEILVRLGLRNAIRWDRFHMEVVADVANGLEAMNVYEQLKPNIIITDLKMPVMDGMELIARIRGHDHETKIIILSCIEDFDMVRQAIHYGVREYILKLTMTPADMEEVLERVAMEIEQGTKLLSADPTINENHLIEKLFKDYLFRQLYTADELQRILHKMCRQLSDRGLMILIVEIDYFDRVKERFRGEQDDFISHTLLDVLREVAKLYQRGEVFSVEKNRFVLIVDFPDVVSEQKREQILGEIIMDIHSKMKALYNVSVTVGISSMKNGFHTLPALYREGWMEIQSKFVRGAGKTLRNSHSERISIKERVIEKLERLIALNDGFVNPAFLNQLRMKIQAYLEVEDSVGNEKKRIVQLLTQIMQLPILIYQLNGEKYQKLSINDHDKLEKSESLDEALDVYRSYMKELFVLYESQTRYSKEITDTLRYINLHFERDLSLKEIADEVRLTPNYFSSLFVKETGHHVVDYIQLLRIEKAKSMLSQTFHKSYEIAMMTGFTDYSYFSRVFKKVTGYNPREFRRKYLKDGEALIHESRRDDGS